MIRKEEEKEKEKEGEGKRKIESSFILKIENKRVLRTAVRVEGRELYIRVGSTGSSPRERSWVSSRGRRGFKGSRVVEGSRAVAERVQGS